MCSCLEQLYIFSRCSFGGNSVRQLCFSFFLNCFKYISMTASRHVIQVELVRDSSRYCSDSVRTSSKILFLVVLSFGFRVKLCVCELSYTTFLPAVCPLLVADNSEQVVVLLLLQYPAVCLQCCRLVTDSLI